MLQKNIYSNKKITFRERFNAAIHAAMWHFSGSLLVSMLVAALVFGLWYPYPYRELAGGLVLFGLVASVDVVCGPLLTLVLFNPAKPRMELLRDLGLVALIQLMALGYGLWTVSVARPVHVVFEVDRFRLITAAEIDNTELIKAPLGMRQLPWSGPTLISVREPRDNNEFLKSIDLSMAGQEPSLRPDWWQEYTTGLSQVLQRAKPLTALVLENSEKKLILKDAVHSMGRAEADLLWLPLTSARTMSWIVFLDKKSGMPKGYAPIDGFVTVVEK